MSSEIMAKIYKDSRDSISIRTGSLAWLDSNQPTESDSS